MTASSENAAPVSISLEDLEYALSLLETEEGSRPGRMIMFRQIIIYATLTIFLLACPLGILVVWFDRIVGIASLVLSVICAVIYIILTAKNGVSIGDNVFSKLKEINVGDVAKKSFDQHVQSFNEWVGCVWIVMIAGGVGGIIWLIIDLIRLGHITMVPLILIVLPFLWLGIFVGVSDYKEFIFYSRVANAWSRFQKVKEKATEKQDGQVSLSASDVELLSQVQTKNVHRSIAQAESNIQRLFAVAINPDAAEFLKKLKEEGLDDYYQIRDAIDALQEDFRPKTATALSQPDLYRMAVTKYQITYRVDNERQRIEVIEIVDGGKEGK